MWILLRLAAFAIGFALRLRTRFEAPREALPWGGRTFFISRAKSKKGQVSYSVGLTFESNVFFSFHRENGLDRFCKSLGFSAEFQTHDSTFDQEVYIASDHGYFLRHLRENAEVRAEILKLFREGVSEIRSDGRHLWVTRRSNGNPTDTEMHALRGLTERFEPLLGSMSNRFSDPFVWKALFIEALVYGIAGYALGGFFELIVNHDTTYPLWSAITARSFFLGMLVLGALLLLTYRLIGRSSRAHRVWVEAILVLIFALPLAAYQITDDLNQGLDRSATEIIERPIMKKWTTTTRRRGRTTTRHYFSLLAPLPSADRVLSPPIARTNRDFTQIQVDSTTYSQAQEGDTLKLTMRAGFLKVPYIERTSVQTRMPSSF